jgi:hypothetical protein
LATIIAMKRANKAEIDATNNREHLAGRSELPETSTLRSLPGVEQKPRAENTSDAANTQLASPLAHRVYGSSFFDSDCTDLCARRREL